MLHLCNKIGDSNEVGWWILMSRGPLQEGPTSLIKKKNKRDSCPLVNKNDSCPLVNKNDSCPLVNKNDSCPLVNRRGDQPLTFYL